MTAPFTPFVTFSDDATPAISAAFLNEIQSQGIAPAAAVAYLSLPLIDVLTAAGTTLNYSAFAVMVLDSVTNTYGYVQMPAGSLTAADYTANPGTFPANSWVYAYAYSATGTGFAELSTTAPTADRRFKTGDTTRRYLFSARTGPSSLYSLARYGRYTRFLDIVDIFGASNSFSAWSATPNVIDCSAFWPPTAQAVDVRIDAIGSTGDAGGGVYLLTLTARGFAQYVIGEVPPSEVGETFQFFVAGTTTLTAVVDTALTNAKGYLRMLGWQE